MHASRRVCNCDETIADARSSKEARVPPQAKQLRKMALRRSQHRRLEGTLGQQDQLSPKPGQHPAVKDQAHQERLGSTEELPTAQSSAPRCPPETRKGRRGATLLHLRLAPKGSLARECPTWRCDVVEEMMWLKVEKEIEYMVM